MVLPNLSAIQGGDVNSNGVMLTLASPRANLVTVRWAMSNSQHPTFEGWVSLYRHADLMIGATQPLYVGDISVIMAPTTFPQRPLNWMHTIHGFPAEITSAPNFAFSESAGSVLSRWKVLMCRAGVCRAERLR